MGIAVGTDGNGSRIASRQPEPPRLIARRRSLPSGRAVVGGLLIALAALGAFVVARGTDTGPSHHYVVVAHDMVAGTTVQESDLTTATVDLPGDLAGRAFTSTGAVAGRVLTTSLSAGELVQASSVVGGNAADPRLQISLPVDRARALDGLLAAGERIDVLVTYGSGSDSVTYVVVRRAQVLRVDQGQRSGLAANSEIVLLLAVDRAADSLAVTHAAQAGAITIVRATAATADDGPDSYRPPASKPG